MRLFKVREMGDFSEFKEEPFKSEHNEKTLESWLEKNPESIVEDSSLLMIGRQVATNLGSYIDLLAVDKEGNIAILELKRDKTPRDTIAQALEYAGWVEGLEYEALEQIFRDYLDNDTMSLLEYHRGYFKLEESNGISFNKEQRIVIVGYDISPEIRQSAVFLRKKGIRTTCVEFNYFKNSATEQLMTVDIVVGKEPTIKGRVQTERRQPTTKQKFLNDLDNSGYPIFSDILTLAEQKKLPIHWGAVGFSLNVDMNGDDVAIIMGYPSSSAYSQTIYTYVPSVITKVKDGKELADTLKERLLQTGLFQQAGNEVKYVITQKPTDEQKTAIINAITEFAEQILKKGPN
jgi:hypothetical protein